MGSLRATLVLANSSKPTSTYSSSAPLGTYRRNLGGGIVGLKMRTPDEVVNFGDSL